MCQCAFFCFVFHITTKYLTSLLSRRLHFRRGRAGSRFEREHFRRSERTNKQTSTAQQYALLRTISDPYYLFSTCSQANSVFNALTNKFIWKGCSFCSLVLNCVENESNMFKCLFDVNAMWENLNNKKNWKERKKQENRTAKQSTNKRSWRNTSPRIHEFIVCRYDITKRK